jgi:hypothetical protein
MMTTYSLYYIYTMGRGGGRRETLREFGRLGEKQQVFEAIMGYCTADGGI